MNCASRLIATVGLTVAMASALYADDAVTPKAQAASHDLAAASDTSADSSALMPPLSLSSWAASEPRPAGCKKLKGGQREWRIRHRSEVYDGEGRVRVFRECPS